MLATSLGTSAHAGETEYFPLKEGRSRLKFRELSRSERANILDETSLLLGGAYSNLDEKRALYGKDFDPLGEIADFRRHRAFAATSDDFARSLIDIFWRLHDIHSRIHLPGPIACYRASLPLVLNRVWKRGGRLSLVVDNGRLGAYSKLAAEVGAISVGDEIVRIDGRSPRAAIDAVEREMHVVRSVNPGNWIHDGIWHLTDRSLDSEPVPPKDDVHLLVRKKGAKKTVRVTLPWILRGDLDCLKEAGMDPFPGALREIGPTAPPTVATALKETSIDGMSAMTFESAGKKIGVLKVAHFVYGTEQSNAETSTAVVKMIEENFAHTDALIVDVRGNWGGYAQKAEILAEVFSRLPTRAVRKRVVATPFGGFLADRARELAPNDDWGLGSDFADSVRGAIDRHERYSAPTPYLDGTVIRDGDFRYEKPFAVLTSADCVSACEVFTATMKDSRHARIFGEDAATAGAGAGTFRHGEFFEGLIPAGRTGPMKAMPPGADIVSSWLQLVRIDGRLVEDRGVEVDEVLRPRTLEDCTGDSMYAEVAKRWKF